jgi:hypothetical protein
MSLGKDNTNEDVDYVVATFPGIVKKLRNMSPMWKEFEEGVIDSVIAPTGRGKSFTQHAADISGKPAHEPSVALPREKLEQLARNAIAETGAKSAADSEVVVKAVLAKTSAQIDTKTLREIVAQLLSGS